MTKYLTKLALVAVLGVGFSLGCDRDRDGYSTRTKLQYVPDMADGPVARTHRTFLNPPEGSVATTAILYPATAAEAEEVLENPFPRSDFAVARGRDMWNIFCVTCHGAQGRGDHTLGEMYPRPPDLTFSAYRERKDGYFFHVITFGNVIMPGYGHAISSDERWQIIHYLRHLQDEAAE